MSVNLTEGVMSSIIYTSVKSEEVTARTIIPITVPKDTVYAIDVSSLTSEEQLELAEDVLEYKKYVKAMLESRIFTFSDWRSQVKPETSTDSLKFRSFKISGIQE